jgi:hypothetical protein
MEIAILIFLAIVSILGLFAAAGNKKQREIAQQEIEKSIEATNSNAYTPTRQTTTNSNTQSKIDSYISENGLSYISHDKSKKCFVIRSSGQSQINIDYKQVVSSEVCVDSETHIKTSRMGQIGGALAGGILAGGVGAIVLGSGAQKQEVRKVKRVDLKVLTKGTESHTHEINFMTDFYGKNGDSAIKKATYWHDLLSVAIKEADMYETEARSDIESNDIAAQISAIAKLKDDGILSEEEFSEAKRKILTKI